MRHVLVAVTGVTPQVVTETLWWLARRSDPPVHVDTLHIATTGLALPRVKSLCGDAGAISRLARDLNMPAPKIEIHVFDGPDKLPLEDIRSSVESAAFGTGITELVRRLTMDPDVAVHASIAGGRKTMGFHLGHAMSLFGRPDDRLSHVLVPPAFEESEDFWYPTSKPTLILNRRGETLDAANADVELTDIQYVRLRGRLTAQELKSAISNPDRLVRRVQNSVDEWGIEAQTTLEVDAIIPMRHDQITSSIGRPLASVLSTFHSARSLVIRISVRPGATPSFRLLLDCRARADTIEHARASVQSLVSDLRHALDVEQTGYRVVICADGPATFSAEWAVRLAPVGQLLREPTRPRIAAVDDSGGIRAVNLGKPSRSSKRQSLPLQAIANSGVAIDITWSIERELLEEQERLVIGAIHDAMARSYRTAAGEVKFDTSTLLSPDEAEAASDELEQWKYKPDGFRMTFALRAARSLPDALVAQIGSAAWGGRPFRMMKGETEKGNDTTVLDLSDCFSGDRLPPFEVPSINDLHLAGLPLIWPPAPRGLTNIGIELGKSGTRTIHLGPDDRARHVYALGSTGTGKSTLLRNMILQDMEAGEGVFVLDPHGDLFDDILNNVPATRADDVILLDAGDVEHPFGINFLEVDPDNRELSGGFAINELLAIFLRLYGDVPEAFGPMFEQYFRIVMMLLVDNASWPEPNLLDVGRIFADVDFRDMLRRGCGNRAVIDLMDMAVQAGGDPAWENVAPYITAKFNRLIVNPLLRNICCQHRSTVDFRGAMDAGRIVLVRLPKGQLTEIDVRLLGMLVIGRLFGAALGRDRKSGNDRRPMHIYIDEFQNFVTETAGQMMAEARKYGLRLTLANQTLAQLDNRMRDIVLGNAASLLAFRTGPSDATTLEPFFGPYLGTQDLQALPNFHCAARILSGGAPVMPPFVMETEPPRQPQTKCASGDVLLARSRERYAKPRASVELVLNSRESNRKSGQFH